jgi:hypothetical protein
VDYNAGFEMVRLENLGIKTATVAL